MKMMIMFMRASFSVDDVLRRREGDRGLLVALGLIFRINASLCHSLIILSSSLLKILIEKKISSSKILIAINDHPHQDGGREITKKNKMMKASAAKCPLKHGLSRCGLVDLLLRVERGLSPGSAHGKMSVG